MMNSAVSIQSKCHVVPSLIYTFKGRYWIVYKKIHCKSSTIFLQQPLALSRNSPHLFLFFCGFFVVVIERLKEFTDCVYSTCVKVYVSVVRLAQSLFLCLNRSLLSYRSFKAVFKKHRVFSFFLRFCIRILDGYFLVAFSLALNVAIVIDRCRLCWL